MEVNGKCHCGQIRYRAKVDPKSVSLCHCTDCQVMSGSAFRVSAHVPNEDFALLAGKVKVYFKTADSGSKRAQAFCPECGTALYAEAAEKSTMKSLRVGCIDKRALLRPTRQIWCDSSLPWVEELSAITPKLAKQS